MTAPVHTRPAGRLRRALAALLGESDTTTIPDVWLAVLRLGG
ncbi:hypothetical protein M2160_007378 [Streptomyces sp. SAI-117]|nr:MULTISPECIES: hypothetical protein [unclassified Streptomyces]MDH6572357.1 hypothetical protein [Streptomyces sp. SAI-117]MDH6582684.1 hypothetical protein [Streptomyces sp. SAI-133]